MQRRVERLQPRRAHRLVEDAADRVAEALELAVLAGERLDHADAGDVLLGVGGQLGDPLLDLLHGGARAGARSAARRATTKRHGGQRDQRRAPGRSANIATAASSDRQQRLADEDEAVAEEEAHGLQVDRRAGHELAGLLAVEEAELEALELLVERGCAGRARRRARRGRPRGGGRTESTSRTTPARRMSAAKTSRSWSLALALHRVDRPAGQVGDRDGRAPWRRPRAGTTRRRRAGTGAGSRAVARRSSLHKG